MFGHKKHPERVRIPLPDFDHIDVLYRADPVLAEENGIICHSTGRVWLAGAHIVVEMAEVPGMAVGHGIDTTMTISGADGTKIELNAGRQWHETGGKSQRRAMQMSKAAERLKQLIEEADAKVAWDRAVAEKQAYAEAEARAASR
jgi:hypothetical protein